LRQSFRVTRFIALRPPMCILGPFRDCSEIFSSRVYFGPVSIISRYRILSAQSSDTLGAACTQPALLSPHTTWHSAFAQLDRGAVPAPNSTARRDGKPPQFRVPRRPPAERKTISPASACTDDAMTHLLAGPGQPHGAGSRRSDRIALRRAVSGNLGGHGRQPSGQGSYHLARLNKAAVQQPPGLGVSSPAG